MKTLYIRTEANLTTATGHMTRCIAIAEKAKCNGINTVFIVAENGSKDLPEANGFDVIVLDRQWDDFNGEIPVMEALIKELNIKCLLIDSYFVSEEYMEAVGKYTKTAYIDDLHERVWPAHIIIDYAVYFDLFDYEGEYPNSERLLGCKYAPVRPEYENVIPKETLDSARECLVVTGGSDENHFMKNLLKLVLSRKDWNETHFTFICGKFNRDYQEIIDLSNDKDNVTVLSPLPSLRDVMNSTDMLITAGGTTLYEMAVCKVPGVAVRIASNQHLNVDGFVRHGLVLDGGDVEADFSYDELAIKIDSLIKDENIRKEIVTRMDGFVDCKGAERIALALGKYL